MYETSSIGTLYMVDGELQILNKFNKLVKYSHREAQKRFSPVSLHYMKLRNRRIHFAPKFSPEEGCIYCGLQYNYEFCGPCTEFFAN